MTLQEVIEAAARAEAETAHRHQLAREAYEAGYDLAYDTGYAARQDTRAYVHGILDGFAAGSQARQQLARELLGPGTQPQIEREPEARSVREPELEAG